ncbi:acyl-CoA N-acyltransferase, partial [Ceratobasidium sp. AG-I]
IGCVYLSFSPFAQGTADVGIALRPNARGRGYGRACISKILRFAFEKVSLHRVVASVFGPSSSQSKEGAKESGTVRWVFEKMGFTPEGVHRRAGFSPTDGVWRDVHTLAMLDTDWVMMQARKTGRECITSPWDTMMERHEKERDQMMEWMEDPGWGKLKRTASTETIK